MDAAWYKCQTRQDGGQPDTGAIGKGKGKDKVSMVDALIASYCLRYGYYVLTLNHQDFCEKFFEIVHIQNSPSTTKFQRDFIALLKPKTQDWESSKTELALQNSNVSEEVFIF